MIHVTYKSEIKLEMAINSLKEYFEKIDAIFSTYRADSEINLIRSRKLEPKNFSSEMQEVLEGCEKAKSITNGAFDPWSLPTGLDTSGYVKGWASQKGMQILQRHGIDSAQINSAGDIYLIGGYGSSPWSIGIRGPNDPKQIVKVIKISDGAIATSGTYEQGSHIFDPITKTIAIGARSATVIGPDGGLAEALATALIVSGRDGAIWFTRKELKSYAAWVIDRNEDVAWSMNSEIFETCN